MVKNREAFASSWTPNLERAAVSLSHTALCRTVCYR